MKRLLLAVVTGVLVLNAGAIRTSAQVEPLPLAFFKNYFITGDYVVGGVGLSGSGRGDIPIRDVPPDTDIVAAYLYWQVVASDNAGLDAGARGVTFRGYPLSGVEGVHGKQLGTGSSTCSASGGGTGGSGGSKTNYTYRADVLRYLEVAPIAPEGNGKTVANGVHSVTVPINNQLEPLGASLVVVYRDPALPLSAIVLYDGGYTMNQANESMSLPLKGFYQSSGESATLTHIVGSGQQNKSENLYFNERLISANPFTSALGGQWDNPTYDVTPQSPAGMTQAITRVDHRGFSSFDCLNWAAVVYRTTVQDTDGDGLLDVWEESTPPLNDPLGQPLPHLKAMGANKDVKDVFIEVGYMYVGDGDVNNDNVPDSTYDGVKKPAHSHMPGHQALKLMGDAFASAPDPINVHFDLGPDYPAGDPLDRSRNAEAYLVREVGTALPRTNARGGEALNETVTQCPSGVNVWDCQFSKYPGTVGWKSGFRFLRDEVLNPVTVPAGQDDPCDAPGATCERRFDRNRTHMFRYALFAHAIGLPENEKACLIGDMPADDVNGSCAPIGGVNNPAFHKPRTNTGIADFPGSDILVTLGGFNDLYGRPVGTPFMQASTLMHEFGHNAERRHGGEALEQNCKPTYLSVMNYMYQLRGLLDDSGTPNLDFSGEIGSLINETNLSALSLQPYRLGWYAPLETSYLAGRSTPARRRCNGSTFPLNDTPMVRIDARTSAAPIDWDADGIAGQAVLPQDVNFNGRVDGPAPFALGGSDDWSNLRLNQIGSRRNVGGIFVDPATGAIVVGPLSLDSGKGDLGKGDLGKGDLGKGDLGKGDLGKGDLGKGDLGKGDLGKGDLGKGDLGGGDLFLNDPNNPSGELDATTAGALGKAAPNTFKACVMGVDCAATVTGTLHDVHVSFTAPNEGNLDRFRVYRVDGADLIFTLPGPTQQRWSLVAERNAELGRVDYDAVDDGKLEKGRSYTYFVVARYLDDPSTLVSDAVDSDPSNLVTIVGVNDPPDAVGDGYATNEDAPLTVSSALGVLANDADVDGDALTATLAAGPSHGALTLNANGSFTYTPMLNYAGGDAFTYRASDGTAYSPVVTVNITVRPVSDAPVAVGQRVQTNEDTAKNIVLTASDVDSGSLTYTVASGPAHGTLGGTPPVLTYTPTADYHGTDAFTFVARDGALDSNIATVSIDVAPVNDRPTISDIANRTIDWNTSTGPLAFTIGDVDGLAGLTVTGVSSNATLVPTVVLGGTEANRAVTVTPAANQSGTAVITVTVSDGSLSASDTFTLTVTRVEYTLFGLQNVPPATITKNKAGSAIPMKWQYKRNGVGGVVVSSAQLNHTITVTGPYPLGPVEVRTVSNTDAGGSSFRYSTTDNSWSFNLQTKNALGVPFPIGDYTVVITPTGDSRYLPSPSFTLTLTK